MKKLIFIILIICVSCRTVYVDKPIPGETKIEYKDRYLKDSIIIHDSIRIYIKGDTVYRDVYKSIYKDRYKHDTIDIIDTLKVPYPVKEVVEVKYTPKRVKILALIGIFSLVVFLYRIYKFFKK